MSSRRILRLLRRKSAVGKDVRQTVTGPSSIRRNSAGKSAAWSLLMSLVRLRWISSRQRSNRSPAAKSSLRNTVPIATALSVSRGARPAGA
ncbi:hypothetical protein ACFFTP_29110 [Streptomyces roseoviridis]|uniref:Uncharacterized protein n=1 Tax=Streptomyces roseoviridis TaxID=67361 RepID=A0ABV5QZJ4_9ACTN